MTLQGKRIVIFGGTGFVGRAIVRRAASVGALVSVPTRDAEKALLLKPMGDVGQIVPVPCSVRSDDSVARAIGDAHAVINLIGILYEKGGNTFQAMHVETAARIARLAREQGARHFVHMSALGAGANSPSSYAQSKAAGESAVRTFFPGATILRPSVIFGPDDHFFNMFARLARISPVLPLIGGGGTKFQPVYVGDVANAAMLALTRPQIEGAIYELGGPGVYTFRELLEMLLAATHRRRLLVNLPWPLAVLKAFFLEMMPRPMLTRDQVKLLKADNVVASGATRTFRELNIAPKSVELILSSYLG